MGMYLNSRPITPLGLIFAFLVNSLGPLPACAATGGVYTQEAFVLPAPGRMVALSPAYSPAVLKGIKIDPQNPFRFHFFVDTGDDVSLRGQNSSVIARSEATKQSHQEQLKQVSTKLIKYFLASLTIPEKDLWVNLSPYEKDRIVPQEFGQTEMGRDLLAEDYLLKQITASLIYPESQLGKAFWQKVYAQAQAKYGTTNIPINTFNKVWIVPDKAVVYENGGTAFVLENHLKVMLEQDYLSLAKNQSPTRGHVQVRIIKNVSPSRLPSDAALNVKASEGNPQTTNALASQIVREIVIPALTKEVNEGKNFSQLRQVFYSLILATWYKKKIKDSILNKVYSNQNKIQGLVIPAKAGPHTGHSQELGIHNKNNVEYIYQQYLQAFKKGVYNYIKEEPDPLTNQTIPRKYFSGGVVALVTPSIQYEDSAQVTRPQRDGIAQARIVDIFGDAAMISQTPSQTANGAKLDVKENVLTLNEEDVRVVKDIYDKVSKLPKKSAWNDISSIGVMLFGLTRYPSDDVLTRLRHIELDVKDVDLLIKQVGMLDTSWRSWRYWKISIAQKATSVLTRFNLGRGTPINTASSRRIVFLNNLNKIINGELKFEEPFYKTLQFWSVLNSKEAEEELKEWDEVCRVYQEIRLPLMKLMGRYIKTQPKDDSIDQTAKKVLFASQQLAYWYFQRYSQKAGGSFDSILMHPLRDLDVAVNHFSGAYYTTEGLEALDSERYLRMTKAFEQSLAFISTRMNLDAQQVRDENIQAQEVLGIVTKREFEKENIEYIYDRILPSLIEAKYVTEDHRVVYKFSQLTDDFKNANAKDYSPDELGEVDSVLQRLHSPRFFKRYSKIFDEFEEAKKIVDPIERSKVEEKLKGEQKLLWKNMMMFYFISNEDWFDVAISRRLGIFYQEIAKLKEQWQSSINALMREKGLSVEDIEKEDKRTAIEGAKAVLIDGRYLWMSPEGFLIRSDQRTIPAFKEVKDLLRTYPRNPELEAMPLEQFVKVVQDYVKEKKVNLPYYDQEKIRETAVQNWIDMEGFRVTDDKLLNDISVEILWRAGIKPDGAMTAEEIVSIIQGSMREFKITRPIWFFGSSALSGVRIGHDIDVAFFMKNIMEPEFVRISRAVYDFVEPKIIPGDASFNTHIHITSLRMVSILMKKDRRLRYGIVYRITQKGVNRIKDMDKLKKFLRADLTTGDSSQLTKQSMSSADRAMTVIFNKPENVALIKRLLVKYRSEEDEVARQFVNKQILAMATIAYSDRSYLEKTEDFYADGLFKDPDELISAFLKKIDQNRLIIEKVVRSLPSPLADEYTGSFEALGVLVTMVEGFSKIEQEGTEFSMHIQIGTDGSVFLKQAGLKKVELDENKNKHLSKEELNQLRQIIRDAAKNNENPLLMVIALLSQGSPVYEAVIKLLISLEKGEEVDIQRLVRDHELTTGEQSEEELLALLVQPSQGNGFDKALISTPGGIDLNPAELSMQVKKDGQDFKFNFNGTEIDAAQAEMLQRSISGATFTIRTMTPVVNLPQVLGLSIEPTDKPKQPVQQLASL